MRIIVGRNRVYDGAGVSKPRDHRLRLERRYARRPRRKSFVPFRLSTVVSKQIAYLLAGLEVTLRPNLGVCRIRFYVPKST